MAKEQDRKEIVSRIGDAAKLYRDRLVGKRFMYVFDGRYIEVIYKAENFRHLTGVASFHHAAHALEYIKTHRMDIAFLDVHVPGADSIALAKTLQQKNPRVNLLFCSDCADYAMTA